MNTSQGSQGALIAGAGGALLILFLFLPWVSIEGAGSLSGWEALTIGDIFFLITGLVAIGAALGAGGALLPGLSLNGAAALLGGIGTVLMLWMLIFDWPPGIPSDLAGQIDAGRQIWAFLAVIATAAIAYGAYSATQEEGTTTRAV